MREAIPVERVIAEVGVAAAIGRKHVASLLFTYRCTLACRHCLFNCSPRKPSVRTPPDRAVEYLRQLQATDRVVHIAGGEAMMFWSDLLAICQAAGRAGVAPHFVETNATFAATDRITRDRLTALRDAGVLGLLISADPYHQEQCPPTRRLRCHRIAVEVFGRENVASEELTLDDLERFRAIGMDPERRAAYARANPPRLVGRAGDDLARHFPDRPLADLRDAMWHGGVGESGCAREFDPETMWEIHIDPYGNIQTCCGIVVGNADLEPLPGVMVRGLRGRHAIIDAVMDGGPQALLPLAARLGYEPRAGCPQRCGLCWEVRRYLRPHYPDVLGPEEIYARDPVGEC
ncbi:MAG TPA: radical SAM protein [Chthonomonadales bacterium]|nr:radical SAM protein [Chthonomonadales bacterium]